MTSDALFAVQTAIVAKLKATDALTALLAKQDDRLGVYDFVDSRTAFPYVVVADVTATPFDTKTERGCQQVVQIHTWDRTHRGFKIVKQIMAEIASALDRASLSISGHDLIDIRETFSTVLRDPDGLTEHGVQHFTVTTEASA